MDPFLELKKARQDAGREVPVVVRSLSGNVIARVQCSGMCVRDLLHKLEEIAPSGPGNTYRLTCGETILDEGNRFHSVKLLVVPPAEVVAVTVRLAEMVISSFEQGQAVIGTIFDKALKDQQNMFLYATAAKDLKTKIREVSPENVLEGGSRSPHGLADSFPTPPSTQSGTPGIGSYLKSLQRNVRTKSVGNWSCSGSNGS